MVWDRSESGHVDIVPWGILLKLTLATTSSVLTQPGDSAR